MFKKFKNANKTIRIYIIILALTALGLALSNDVMSNYFKDAYKVTTYQRGLIEFPRELPGVLVLLLVTVLSSLSDIRLAILAQFLSIFGIFILGLFTPAFAIMLVFIFINSLGMHLYMPLQDSIGMSIVKKEELGKRMGQFKGVSTAFTMLGSIVVFIGFKVDFFSFTGKTKWIFILSAAVLSVIPILFLLMEKSIKDQSQDTENISNVNEPKKDKKFRFIFRKEYKYYYTLVIMFGVQKQIMMVYGPWVLIELLNKKADTIAVLGIIGAFIGIFFIPAIGRWLDKFGIKKLLYVDALSFIGVYLLYGFLAYGFISGRLPVAGISIILAYSIFIFDKMSNQLGMIRTIYLKSIAVYESDVRPTLSLGLSFDHIVSIICAYLGGVVWSLWGPQYLFFLAAALSFVNLYVASKVENKIS